MREILLGLLMGMVIGIILGIMVNVPDCPNYVYGPFNVIDGDTVKKTFRDKYMDTPEVRSPKEKQLQLINNSTCLKKYGALAKNYTISHLASVQTSGVLDKYKRELVTFLDKRGYPLALDMVSQGLAFCYYRDPIDEISAQCLILEEIAKREKIGMWGC